MRVWAKEFKDIFSDRAFLLSFLAGVLFLLISLVTNSLTNNYATVKAGSAVGDIFLDNVPVVNLDWLYVYGPIFPWLIALIICLRRPRQLPFALKTIALFVLIRSIFVTLTHIGVSPEHIPADPSANLFKQLSFGGDLFFSGHTGAPFLNSLIFKKNIYVRTFFVIMAIFFGLVVLLVHMHYSIDVLAAFFITYSIYRLAEIFFVKDLKVFNQA